MHDEPRRATADGRAPAARRGALGGSPAHRRRGGAHLLWALFAVSAPACSVVVDGDLHAPASTVGPGDAASLDATAPDARPLDARLPDGGGGDLAAPDGRAPDQSTLRDARPPDADRADTGPLDAQLLDRGGLDRSVPDASPPDLALPDLAPPDLAIEDMAIIDAGAVANPATACERACDHVTRCARAETCEGLVFGNTPTLYADCIEACGGNDIAERIAAATCGDAIQHANRAYRGLLDTCHDPDPCLGLAAHQIQCMGAQCEALRDDADEITPLLVQRCHRQLASGELNAFQLNFFPLAPCPDPFFRASYMPLLEERREIRDWCNGRTQRSAADCADNCGRVAACVPLDDARSDSALCVALCRADWSHEAFYDCVEARGDCSGAGGACGPMHPYFPLSGPP